MATISTEKLIQLCHRVGISLRSGVPIVQVWKTEAKLASGVASQHYTQIHTSLENGSALADALRNCQGFFPALVCDMVEVGERTGKLDSVWLRLEENYKHQQTLRNSFLRGIAWPMFQLVFAILIIGGLMSILGVIAEMPGGEQKDVLGIGLVGFRGAIIFWILCGLFIGWIALTCYSVVCGWWGPAPVRLAMRLPVVGRALESLALSRLTWSLAMALNSGMDAVRSVELAIRTTLNVYYTAHIAEVAGAIRRGEQFFEAFASPKVYPEEFISSLQVAEVSGTTSESLERLAEQYQDKAKTALNILTAASTVFVMVMVGLLLVFMIIRLFMVLYLGPINDALKEINGI